MLTQSLVNVMLAVVTAETVHALSEMISARFKVRQLAAWISGRPAPVMPVNVDTRPKAYGVLAIVAAVLFGVSYAIFDALDLSLHAAVVYVIAAVGVTYAITGLGLDRFHVEIGSVGRQIRALVGNTA